MSTPLTELFMELIELFWSQLQSTEDAQVCLATEEILEKLYQYGLADTRRMSLAQWKMAFAKFPKTEGAYRLCAADKERVQALLFKGNIKKPFDPHRLKFGARPLNWFNEVYQKVLRFETTLTLQEWNQKIEQTLKPRFVKGGEIQFNAELRDLLAQWLEAKAAPLRRLELWVQSGIGPEMPAPKTTPVEKKAVPQVIHDQYRAKPEEIKKKAAIDKLYYQYEPHPEVADDDALSFLDELSNLEDEEDKLS